MNKLKFLKIILLFFIITSANATKHNTLEKVSLQLHWKYQFEFAGFIAAKEKGFYKKAGLDVDLKEYKFGMNIANEVLTRKSTYGIYNSNLLLSYLDNKPVKLIASFFKRSALVIITKPNIKTLADLTNKTIMAGTKEDFNFNFKYIFDEEKIDINHLNFIPHSYNIDDFINGKCDAMTAFISDQPYKLDKLHIPYNIIDPSKYGIYNLQLELFTSKKETVDHFKRTKLFKQASIKGWEYALSHKDEIIKIIMKKYNTNLSYDFLMNEAKQTELLMLPKIYKIGSVDKKFLIKQFQLFHKNSSKKHKLDNFYFESLDNKLNFLTSKEKEYLKNKKSISICIKENWLPYEGFKNQRYVGISADFLNMYSKKLNLDLKINISKNQMETLNKLNNKICDIKPLYVHDNLKTIPYRYTKKYFYDHISLVTRLDQGYIQNLKLIKEPLLVTKGFRRFKLFINQKYPNIKLKQVKDTKTALEMVVKKEAFGYIGMSLPSSRIIQQKYSTRLKISNSFKEISFGFGVVEDDLMLKNILDKVIEHTTQKEKNIILNKWIAITVEKDIDYKLLIIVSLILITIILLISYFLIKAKKQTYKLFQQKELYDLVFENSASGVLILDASTFRINNCNNKILDMLKYNNKEDIIDSHISYLSPIYSKDNITLQDKVNAIINLEDFTNTHMFEWKLTCSYGKEFWAEITIVTINIDNTEIIYIMLKDINETKSAQYKLEKLNKTLEIRVAEAIEQTKLQQEQILQQSRLAQMGEMISMIAHQWRQPLAAISAVNASLNVKVQLGEMPNPDTILKSTNKVSSYLQHLTTTIDDFRDFFKPNKKKEDTTYNQILYSTLNIIEVSIATQNIKLIKNTNSIVVFHTYPNDLKQVLLNIIKNSKDALIENHIKDPYIKIETFDNILTIEDNAGGIESDIIDKIFDPYFSTKDEKNGTGLGLYMSKMIIEEHCNGKISVKNTTDGAMFTIDLGQGLIK